MLGLLLGVQMIEISEEFLETVLRRKVLVLSVLEKRGERGASAKRAFGLPLVVPFLETISARLLTRSPK